MVSLRIVEKRFAIDSILTILIAIDTLIWGFTMSVNIIFYMTLNIIQPLLL